MRSRVLVLLILLACAREAAAQIKIDKAWVRAVPPSVTDSAAFMRIQNTGDTPVRLTGGNTPIANMAMPMKTTHKTVQGVDVLGMAAVDSLEVPPRGTLVLEPGGNHLMLMNLTAHPRAGEMIVLSLLFEPGDQKVTVRVPVQLDAP